MAGILWNPVTSSPAYNVLAIVALAVALVFTALVLLTGKGDAMSGGGGSVRTTFRGKAGIDDQISKLVFYLGGAFVVLMIVLEAISSRIR